MKNKISDLRDHMFAALERLGDAELTPEQVKSEIEKAKAVSELGKVLVESVKTELLYAKLTGTEKSKAEKFLEIPHPQEEEKELKKLERPDAVYTNKSFS